MSTHHGAFLWYDLLTPDPTAAETFYGHVLGWEAQQAGIEGHDYRVLSMDGIGLGGMMPMTADARAAGAVPGWIGYIAVDDVDGAVADLRTAGGTVHRPPMDIPGIGRFAVATDPQGAAFMLFRGMGEAPPSPTPGTPGFVGWHELQTTDWATAFSFYAALFGWTKDRAVDIGPMGTYQLFSVNGVTIGGMMNMPAERPYWRFYVNVGAIRPAQARVTEAGGTILHGPSEVPGGSWILHCRDPQGVGFALVGPDA